MKSIIITAVFILAVFSPEYAFPEKASTIDELVTMYDITPCVECHKDKYEEWKTSSMGNSVSDPRVLRGMRTFIRLAIDKEDALERKDLTICLDCHVPQIKDAAPELVLHIGDLVLTAIEDTDQTIRETATKELSKLNINCFVCHNLKSKGFDKQTEKGVIYGPKKLDYSPHKDPHKDIGFKTEQSKLMTTSGFCAVCHHCPPSVPWEQCPTIYTSYVDQYIKKGHKETCQDCHMEGEKLSHKFLGPNNLDFLRSSVDLTVNARPTRYIDIYKNDKMPAVIVMVNIKNYAGHEIPHG